MWNAVVSKDGLRLFFFTAYGAAGGASSPSCWIFTRTSLSVPFPTANVVKFALPWDTGRADNAVDWPMAAYADPHNNVLYALYSQVIKVYNYTFGNTAIGSEVSTLALGGKINTDADNTLVSGALVPGRVFWGNIWGGSGYYSGFGYYPPKNYTL
jgi:hypothetical protein